MKRLRSSIPGIDSTAAGKTDLAVLRPYRLASKAGASDTGFSHWLAGLSPNTMLIAALVFLAWPVVTLAQGVYTTAEAFDALRRWMPFLVTQGFALNILISFFTMLIGTVAGVLLGLGHPEAEARKLLEATLSTGKRFKDVDTLLHAVYESNRKPGG